jgi:superfamily II DNA or RNA helicase
VATGRYLGEGFDDARLDTLFLTMPISWRGILAQYAGRLHRLHAAKRDVVIYDYVDGNEPMLAKMAVKREAGYRSLGYRAVSSAELDIDPSSSDRLDRS